MNSSQIVVTLAGVGAVALVVWFFWLKQAAGTRAALTSGGWQEQLVLVKGGYTPDTIVVERGKPVRLTFLREEASPCSETVIFDAFKKSARLPEGEQVALELPPPAEAGEYAFTCGMGMLQGRLVVE